MAGTKDSSGNIINSVGEDGTTFNATKSSDDTISTEVSTPEGSSSTTTERSDTTVTFKRDSSDNIVVTTETTFNNESGDDVNLQTASDSEGNVKVVMQVTDGTSQEESNSSVEAPVGSSVNTDVNGTVSVSVDSSTKSCEDSYKKVNVKLFNDATIESSIETYSCSGELLDTKVTLIKGQIFTKGSIVKVERSLDSKLHVKITTPLNGTIEF